FIDEALELYKQSHFAIEMHTLPLDICGITYEDCISDVAFLSEQDGLARMQALNLLRKIPKAAVPEDAAIAIIDSTVGARIFEVVNTHGTRFARIDEKRRMVSLFHAERRISTHWFTPSGVLLYSFLLDDRGQIESTHYYDTTGALRLARTGMLDDDELWVTYNQQGAQLSRDTEEDVFQRWLLQMVNTPNEPLLCEWIPYPQVLSQVKTKRNAKIIISMHNSPFKQEGYKRQDLVESAVGDIVEYIDKIDVLVTLCDEMRYDIYKLLGRIHPAVHTLEHYVAPPPPSLLMMRDPYKIVMVSRFDEEQKNFADALEAFKLVYAQNKRLHLEIWGEGKDRAIIERLIDKFGLESAASLKGPTEQPRAVFLSAGCLLLTSNNEGFALTIREAALCECPTISYDCKYGPRDQIEHGVTGLLVRQGNIEELADSMALLVSQRAWQRSMGKAACARAQEHTKEKFVAQWHDVFELVGATLLADALPALKDDSVGQE
ncbi:MAG: glycosyltransferase, partial [Eggerthellaceae bacterium]|nr:glycosyltransferase [Eggerthellaceae bacterium]